MIDGAIDQANIRRTLGARILPPRMVVAAVVDALIDVEAGDFVEEHYRVDVV